MEVQPDGRLNPEAYVGKDFERDETDMGEVAYYVFMTGPEYGVGDESAAEVFEALKDSDSSLFYRGHLDKTIEAVSNGADPEDTVEVFFGTPDVEDLTRPAIDSDDVFG